jgi:hypothetical protein
MIGIMPNESEITDNHDDPQASADTRHIMPNESKVTDHHDDPQASADTRPKGPKAIWDSPTWKALTFIGGTAAISAGAGWAVCLQVTNERRAMEQEIREWNPKELSKQMIETSEKLQQTAQERADHKQLLADHKALCDENIQLKNTIRQLICDSNILKRKMNLWTPPTNIQIKQNSTEFIAGSRGPIAVVSIGNSDARVNLNNRPTSVWRVGGQERLKLDDTDYLITLKTVDIKAGVCTFAIAKGN